MHIKAPLKPTEDPEQLKEAILNLFPYADLETKEKEVTGETEFQELWRQVEERKIKDTVKKELQKNRKKDKTELEISKTAATSGKLSLAVKTALGNIKLIVPWEEIEKNQPSITKS